MIERLTSLSTSPESKNQERQDYSSLRTINSWIEFRNNHGFEGLTPKELRKTKEGNSLYCGFHYWAKAKTRQMVLCSQIKPEERKIQLKKFAQAMFPPRFPVKTIEDWIQNRDENGWQGLTTSQIRETKKGQRFCKNFRTWARSEVTREILDSKITPNMRDRRLNELVRVIFRPKNPNN